MIMRVLQDLAIDLAASLIVLSLMAIGFIETLHWLKGF